MTKNEVLIKIRQLRDEINNIPADWTNGVVYSLDQIADTLEDTIAKEQGNANQG